MEPHEVKAMVDIVEYFTLAGVPIMQIEATERDFNFALQWHAACHEGWRPWNEHGESLRVCDEMEARFDRAIRSLLN